VCGAVAGIKELDRITAHPLFEPFKGAMHIPEKLLRKHGSASSDEYWADYGIARFPSS
jgi:hypothetical protein